MRGNQSPQGSFVDVPSKSPNYGCVGNRFSREVGHASIVEVGS